MSLLPQDPKAQGKVAVGVVALAALAVYYQYPYTAAADALDARAAHVEQLESANAKARHEAAAGLSPAQLAREAERSRATLAMLRRLVPTEHEVPGLLEQVSTAARRAGLEIGGVAPEPMLPGVEFDTYRYKLTVTGPYHPLATFLANVGSLPRIVAPVTFQLVPKADAGGRDVRHSRVGTALAASVTVQTYVAHPLPAAPVRTAHPRHPDHATTAAGASEAVTVAAAGEVLP